MSSKPGYKINITGNKNAALEIVQQIRSFAEDDKSLNGDERKIKAVLDKTRKLFPQVEIDVTQQTLNSDNKLETTVIGKVKVPKMEKLYWDTPEMREAAVFQNQRIDEYNSKLPAGAKKEARILMPEEGGSHDTRYIRALEDYRAFNKAKREADAVYADAKGWHEFYETVTFGLFPDSAAPKPAAVVTPRYTVAEASVAENQTPKPVKIDGVAMGVFGGNTIGL
jgi:hypothetical protein